MKTIKLLALGLVNFKGLSSYILKPVGRSITVWGDNATGKTTLFDAWTWLLSGRDSAGRADFSIKTLGEDGQPIPGIDHTVEAWIAVDDEEVRLTRSYREKWQKKRGAAVSELTGHTTEYQIDGIPLQEKDWKERLSELLGPEATFSLVTSPAAFAGLHWAKRREILLSLAGGVGEAEIVKASPDLAGLPALLGRRSPEDHRKVVTGRRKEINARLDQIPARIDELTRTLAGIDGLDREALTTRLAEVEQRVSEARAGAGDEGLIRERAKLETERLGLAGRRQQERQASQRDLRSKVAQAKVEAYDALERAKRKETEARACEARATKLDADAARLREKWAAAAAPHDAPEGICPTCGQAYPPEMMEAIVSEARKAQAELLAAINSQGKAIVAAAQKAREEAEKAIADAGCWHEQEEQAQNELTEAADRLAALDQEPHPVDDQIKEIVAKVAAIDRQLKALTGATPDLQPLQEEQRAIQGDLARLDAAVQTQARIAELAAEQKMLAAEYDRLEQELYLLDRYVSIQAELTESKVNGMFEMARFRLFKAQINGGLEQCCDILVEGVPYGSGLNRGAEMNAGLDIARTLSRHFGVQAPIFLDNSECNAHIIDVGAQTIRLRVDGACEKMEVFDE
jgi:predicted nuclease with TOPRIM domain